jgi:hypothetical protein
MNAFHTLLGQHDGFGLAIIKTSKSIPGNLRAAMTITE